MTPRCYEIGEFMLCQLYGAWPLPEPRGVKLLELSEYLLLNIKDPAKFGVDVFGWAER